MKMKTPALMRFGALEWLCSLFGIGSLIVCFFSMKISFMELPFLFLIFLVFFFLLLAAAIVKAVRRFKRMKGYRLIAIGILLLTVFLMAVFPWRKAYATSNFYYYREKRTEAVHILRRDDSNGEIELPSRYRNLSESGRVYKDGDVIFFVLYRSLESESGLVYMPDTPSPERENEERKIQPIWGEKNWFYVVTQR